jgi:hypothetical protein
MNEKIIHGFHGQCEPSGLGSTHKTFSLGVFPILNKASGKGTKRGPVKVRVSGSVKNAEAVKAKARQIMEQLDAGTYVGPKTVRVK